MKRLIPFFLGAALLVPITSSAVTFDNMCAPETEHNPGLLAPNLAFMLDKSGSMDDLSSNPIKTRWEAAEEAINETVLAYTTPGACTGPADPNCDKIRFGLALFSNDATFPVIVGEDASNDIATALIGSGPGGGTAMGLAGEFLESESTLNDPTRANYSVFITDGNPQVHCSNFSLNRDTLVDAVLALCNASTRSNPLITSVIGFGGDTNTDTVSLLAAAGGTGSCCDATNCAANPIDVCSLGRSQLNAMVIDFFVNNPGCTSSAAPDPSIVSCTGGIDVSSNTALKDAISGIVTAAACTFPLDIPAGYPDGAAQTDPDYTRVELNHAVYGQVAIDNIGDCDAPTPTTSSFKSPEYDDEGWCFANDRKSIRVTTKLCEDIGASDIDKVITQVACFCSLTGQACSITNVMCNGGHPCTNAQLMNMPCSAGEYICDQGVDVCAATGMGALPEICNGVDDNCDGIVDNLVDSEADWNMPPFSSFKDTTALHCAFEDVCACVGGAKAAVTINGGVNQLIADAISDCTCRSALEFEENATYEESEHPEDSAATCSALSKDPSGLLYLLLPIGLVGFMRRRKD